MEYSLPASSSYRHARLVECGIDTQAGNKNRLSRVMFCLRYVNFISCPFRSLSHKPLLIQYSVNNKCLKNERNIQLVILFCLLHVYGNGILIPPYRSRDNRNMLVVFSGLFCVLLLTAKNRKFCKIRRSALIGGICITKKCKKIANFAMAN